MSEFNMKNLIHVAYNARLDCIDGNFKKSAQYLKDQNYLDQLFEFCLNENNVFEMLKIQTTLADLCLDLISDYKNDKDSYKDRIRIADSINEVRIKILENILKNAIITSLKNLMETYCQRLIY